MTARSDPHDTFGMLKPPKINVMGKLNDSLLSGSSGRTGRLVVANVAGTEILRVRPRKKTTPPSPKQLLIQNRMKKCYDFILPYKGYASVYFGYRQGMRSSYNQAITNLLNAFKLDYALMTISPDFPEIEFSRGNLLAAVPTGIDSATVGALSVEWYNNSGANPDRLADQLQLLYYEESHKSPVFLENLGERTDTTVTVPLPPYLSGKELHVWIAFRSQDGVESSISAYAGSVVIL